MEVKKKQIAKLVLEDGSEFSGWSFGKKRSAAAEVVFNTGMNGLAHVLTDPSCYGQIIVSTYPLAGNTGVTVNKEGKPFFDDYGIPVCLESNKIHASGLIVSELCSQPSHHSKGITLSLWLEKENVPGIYGIDTRALAVRLRDRGTMKGKILIEDKGQVTMDFDSVKNPFIFSEIESKIYIPKSADKKSLIKIAVIDLGLKENIIRCLLAHNAEVIRLGYAADLQKIDCDGIVISSGPGDPKDYNDLIEKVRKILALKKPVLGIGLGSLLMALANGADTHKLPFGHRGQNQPCREEGTNSCYATTQNHGYAIRENSLPAGWKTWFTNTNDGSIEGFKSDNGLYSGVLFYPEGCPGSTDTSFIFDNFIQQVSTIKTADTNTINDIKTSSISKSRK